MKVNKPKAHKQASHCGKRIPDVFSQHYQRHGYYSENRTIVRYAGRIGLSNKRLTLRSHERNNAFNNSLKNAVL